MRHEYGGVWTRTKLEILEEYTSFFTTALKAKGFRLHYADAFAGTGQQSLKNPVGQGQLIPPEEFAGSVRVSLDLKHSFDVYHFNDKTPEHYRALKEVASEYPERDIRTSNLDANLFVSEFCAQLGSNDRCVLFLDPYSTQLEWNTLGHVAKSGRIDLFLLFPISALLRMTPRAGAKDEWKKKIDLLLGTPDWVEAFYRPKEAPLMGDLFGDQPQEEFERLNGPAVADFIKTRLSDLFPYVADPVTLYANGSPLFLFFFAISNQSNTAKGLARKVSGAIFNKQRQRG